MLVIFFLLIFCVLMGVVFLALSKNKVEVKHVDLNSIQKPGNILPYVKKRYFMTQSELNFFNILENLNQGKYFIVPQVSLSRLVSVDDREVMKKTYHNKIDRKSVDFVIFNRETFIPELVIELDDRSHDRFDRKIRDTWVDDVMKKVGIKIFHIKTSYNYDVDPILKLLNQ